MQREMSILSIVFVRDQQNKIKFRYNLSPENAKNKIFLLWFIIYEVRLSLGHGYFVEPWFIYTNIFISQ